LLAQLTKLGSGPRVTSGVDTDHRIARHDEHRAVDPSTGGQKFSVQMEHSTVTSNGSAVADGPPQTGRMIVAGDGGAYVAYEYSAITGFHTNVGGSPPPWFSFTNIDYYLKIMRVGTDGSSTKTLVKSWSADSEISFSGSSVHRMDSGNMDGLSPIGGARKTSSSLAPATTVLGSDSLDGLITNADQGVLFSFLDPSVEGVPPTQTLATVSTGGGVQLSTMNGLPGQVGPINPTLQTQDGSFVGRSAMEPGILTWWGTTRRGT
jgi:hypothetical protein